MRFLEGREMRNFGQAHQVAKIGRIFEKGHDPAVVRAEELLEHHHGEQLVLSKVLPGESRGIRRKSPPSHTDGHPGQRLGRTRHASLCLHGS